MGMGGVGPRAYRGELDLGNIRRGLTDLGRTGRGCPDIDILRSNLL